VATLAEPLRVVDDAFAARSEGLEPWPDPHPDRAPLEEEYSRVLDPGKWRLVPARAEAWCDGLVRLGLATLERDAAARWRRDRNPLEVRVDRLVPHRGSALPLVLGYLAFDGADINGVTIGAGDPAVEVTRVPPCGCDACDSGSQPALDAVDEHMAGVVTGVFRHLTDGERTVLVHSAHGWAASGRIDPDDVDGILADPTGWDEVSGASWLADGR
jgi:hypothetical protein